jgi:hypothetical protein
MPATRTRIDDHAGLPPAGESGQPRTGPGPAGPGPEDEVLSRLGDAIDDRIADVLEEMLAERDDQRPHRRLPRALGVFSLLLALGVTILLRHSTLAVCTIWPATATLCLAAAWPTRPTRAR